MLQEWENGFVGNNAGRISGLPRRETFAQVLVRAFGEVQAASGETVLRRAA
ncbi:hypothetical protein [Tsuneonella amylolytica]|uniref:hypothetical protein n=1 Tax=Tsuneonella amylolytica TaxID=2338327 RepID=UPI0013C47A5B|nr:hypothetical protein [Tsuneonella amylolytica]